MKYKFTMNYVTCQYSVKSDMSRRLPFLGGYPMHLS